MPGPTVMPRAPRSRGGLEGRQASHLTALYLMVAELRRKWSLVSKASSKQLQRRKTAGLLKLCELVASKQLA